MRPSAGSVALTLASLISLAAAGSPSSVSTMPNGTGNTVMFAPYLLVPAATVPETFLSFNFDWNLNVTADDAWTDASFGWTLDLQDTRLRALAKALAPANLRIGGSDADLAVYNEDFPGGIPCPQEVVDNHQCLTPHRWDETIAFANDCGLRLVFTLNMMAGRCGRPSCGHNGTGPWDPSNARALLNYTRARHANFSRHGFELGNELEFTLSSAQTATAFRELRAMVDEFWPDPALRPRVVGPAQNIRPDALFLTLSDLAPGDLDAVSYHVYPGYGRSLDLPTLMLQPGWLDFSHQIMGAVQRAAQSTGTGRAAELWIGETAAAWASGTEGVCNGFVSGFWWLDQLAQAATTGHGAMCRQCLVGGNYSLLDQLDDFRPNPDYWSAWVWRAVMGTTFTAITQVTPYEGDFRPLTRAYMACTRPGAPGFKPGAVTLLYINSDANNASVLMYQQSRLFAPDGLQRVRPNSHRRDEGAHGGGSTGSTAGVGGNPWPPTPPPFPQLPRVEFVLTAADAAAGLLSRSVALNGVQLEFDAVRNQLPSLAAAAVHGTTENWVVPGHSYGFAVYREAAAPACL